MVASTEGVDSQLLTETADYLFTAPIKQDRTNPALLNWGFLAQ